MERTVFSVEKMDCAAEEQLIRMGLEGADDVESLVFDLPARRLTVYHSGDPSSVRSVLTELGMGSCVVVDTKQAHIVPERGASTDEWRPLVAALAINAAFFVGEMAAGLLAGSMGLVADSLDMLADAFVYALSLAAVGGSLLRKKRLARYSGYLQFSLAIFGLVEVARRFVTAEAAPDVVTMVVVASLALLGNVATLLILSRAKRGEAHVEASWIFTSNDIKVNALVIVSAVFVWATASGIPDLLAGAFIFLIVASGARQILALAK